MPYVDETLRVSLDPKINDLVAELRTLADQSKGEATEGITNYAITRILIGVFGENRQTHKRSYKLFNAAVGVMGCVVLELYRCMVAPYEDVKKKENGDVYPIY